MQSFRVKSTGRGRNEQYVYNMTRSGEEPPTGTFTFPSPGTFIHGWLSYSVLSRYFRDYSTAQVEVRSIAMLKQEGYSSNSCHINYRRTDTRSGPSIKLAPSMLIKINQSRILKSPPSASLSCHNGIKACIADHR